MEGKFYASMLKVISEREKNNGDILKGNPDINRGRVQDEESISIEVEDLNLKVLSEEKYNQMRENLARRQTEYALSVKGKVLRPITKEAVTENNKKLYTPTNRIGETRE